MKEKRGVWCVGWEIRVTYEKNQGNILLYSWLSVILGYVLLQDCLKLWAGVLLYDLWAEYQWVFFLVCHAKIIV